MNARRRWKWAIVLVAVAAAALTVRLLVADTKVRLGSSSRDLSRPSVAEVSHSPYDLLLRKYVDDRGLVAYGPWKSAADDLQSLDDYLAVLGSVDLGKTVSKEARLAFWINAYNALTLKGILREYPTTSIRNHTAKWFGYNIWKDLLLCVDQRHYSLDDIEHKILRKLGEPRIHFAIVCASIGCPPLVNRAYFAEEMDSMLAANARRFFARETNFHADPAKRTISVSQLLQWYGTDFAPTPAEQMRPLRRYFPSADSFGWIESAPLAVSYLDYDWRLNDQK
jgi:hypothetical protein